jgi:hypothetical protein
MAENLQREDLNDIEIAEGLKALAEELGLKTHKEIAAEVDHTASWVSQHLRLLQLPESVQERIAEKAIPVKAERQLRQLASASPRIAECICELAKREKIKPGDFIAYLPDLISSLPNHKFADPPTMIPAIGWKVSKIVPFPELARDLGDRLLAARPYLHTADPVIDFATEEIDAARAAGCLLEFEADLDGWSQTLTYITDSDVAVDLLARHVEAAERTAAEKRKKEADQAELASRAAQGGGKKTESKKDAGPTPHEKRKAAQAKARTWNLDLGRNLATKNQGSRKDLALVRAKAIVLSYIDDHRNLAARGLRLVLTQLQEVEQRQLKTTGEQREDVAYATPEEAQRWLKQRVEMARTANEVIEVAATAMIAAILADEEELPKSKRVYNGTPNLTTAAEILRDEVAAVKPAKGK